MKLIIVDDEPKIRKGLFKLLEAQEGFKVTGVFEDVHSALKALYELEADVIITDIKMPEVSGLELIRQIRERNLNIRIIILSGYSNFSYAQKAIELGVTRYLLKPTDPRELLSVLREVERELLPEAPEYEGRQGQAADGENEIGNLLVVKAIQYIEVHYGGKITLKDMARELHLSPNYLCELFKRHTGKNLMRMDQRNEQTAADIINTYSEFDLYRIIRDYGEDKFAKNIAKHIVRARQVKPIETTGELTEIIKGAIPAKIRAVGGHPSKRTFQAIRIELNKELEVLSKSLDTMIDLLNPGGRLSIITFHSLEDRMVKTSFKTNEDPWNVT